LRKQPVVRGNQYGAVPGCAGFDLGRHDVAKTVVAWLSATSKTECQPLPLTYREAAAGQMDCSSSSLSMKQRSDSPRQISGRRGPFTVGL
jgi:hypothetical protein